MSSLLGYKSFKENLSDNFGNQYELNKIYTYKGEIKFGKSGFHFCTNLEDTLRYFNSFNEKVEIALIKGFKNIHYGEDTYNDFYDMYATSDMEILKVLSRKEIIDYMLKTNNDIRINRFISLYKLTEEEINVLLNSEYKPKIYKHISYYQYNNKDAFIK